jgi:AAHS family 4-hydroxybenzoate transporter-like MFS transporter
MGTIAHEAEQNENERQGEERAMTKTSAQTSRTVDLVQLINQLDIRRFHFQLLALCAGVVFMDGFDAQAIGYVAPTLSQTWHLAPGALGPVFGSGLFGIMLGALVGGPLADYIGRKRVIIFAAIFFGICTLITAFAGNVQQLLMIRFITGVGLGAAMPNAIALISEYSPKRHHAIMVMTMFCGFSLGAALGGLVAGLLVPAFGWSSVFIFGGVVPLLLAPVLWVALPESVRFLLLRDPNDPRINIIIENLAGTPAGAARFVISEEQHEAFTLVQLFTHGRALATVLLWVVFFMNLLNLYFLSNWLPTVMHDMGLSISTAAFTSALFQVGGTVAPFLLGWLIDRYGFHSVLVVTYILAAVVIGLLGSVGPGLAMLMVTVFAAGFCVVGAQSGSNALAASLYPTSVRSTGVGWALGIGRIGSIIGPVVGGMMLAQHWDRSQLFLFGAIPALCAMAAVAAMWMTKPPAAGRDEAMMQKPQRA